MLELDADLVADPPGLLLITDKRFAGEKFEQSLRPNTAPLCTARLAEPKSWGGRAEAHEGPTNSNPIIRLAGFSRPPDHRRAHG